MKSKTKRSVYTVTTFFTEASDQPTEREYTETHDQAEKRRSWILNNLENVESVEISDEPEEMDFLV